MTRTRRTLTVPATSLATSLATVLATSLLTGALATFSICAMAAWDLSFPPPKKRFNIVVGHSGFPEPELLRLWRTHVARDRPETAYQSPLLGRGDAESAREESRWVGSFSIGEAWWTYHLGRGLCDRVSSMTLKRPLHSEGSYAPDFASMRAWFRRRGDTPSSAPETEFEFPFGGDDPRSRTARGSTPAQWSPALLWERCAHDTAGTKMSRIPVARPRFISNSLVSGIAGDGFLGRRETETRIYGWPLRCMWVAGVRDQEWEVDWQVPDSGKVSDGVWIITAILRDDHWTNALFDVGQHAEWSCDSELPPASGIPWRPLWLPFLANCLLLGVPLTLTGIGVRRGTRAGWRWLCCRGGTRCPHCGYSRVGIAESGRCPECGEQK